MGTGPTYKESNLNKRCFTPDEQGIIQLNPSSLALESRWQLPKKQAGFDLDFGATPTLFTAIVDGTNLPLVGAENKDGFYYVFNRRSLNSGPVWTYQAESNAALNGGELSPCGDLNTDLFVGLGWAW